MRKKYFSNASWTKIPDSQDEHESFEGANVICMRLIDEYGSVGRCDIRGKCFKSWVTNEKGEKLKEYECR
tara:strand:+ start:2645 stop:2854 length:210 start_codon:yes stop_codon:yes gene_type:complete